MPLHLSIDKAANIVGSQTKLAQMLDIYPTHLSNMKAGTRPCTINTRVRIAEIAGDDPQRAIIEGLIDQLDKDNQRHAAHQP